MTVLVTGATGFIGQALTRRLLEAGQRVRVLARRPDKVAAAGLPVHEIYQGDITDPDAVDRAVAGADLVYGIAGTFREPGLSDERYREVNVEAVRHLLEAAKRHGTRRVVHCSTVGIHGSISGSPATEEAPLQPDGIYEVTKAEGDQLALSYARSGLDVVVLRPAPVYGPGDTRLAKLFKLASKRRVMLLGDGKPHYHMVYIDDLVDAFQLAGAAPGIGGEAFIIGGEERPTLEELIRRIGRLADVPEQKIVKLPAGPMLRLGDLCERVCRPLGVSPPIYRRRVEFFINNRAYNIGKAVRRLGFKPRTDLDSGLRRTRSWYRKLGYVCALLAARLTVPLDMAASVGG